MKYSIRWFLNGHRGSLLASLLFTSGLCLGCGGPAPLTVDMPLHLEDHLDVATIVGSEVPAEVLAPVEWHFDEPQPDWKPISRSAVRGAPIVGAALHPLRAGGTDTRAAANAAGTRLHPVIGSMPELPT